MRKKRITDFLKGFFGKNKSLKIFSLILAFAVWFVVMSYLNPSETRIFSVPLTIEGIDELENGNLVCLNIDSLKDQDIRIKISATRPDLNNLSAAKDKLSATADVGKFSGYYSRDLTQPVSVSVVPSLSDYSNLYEIVGYSPSGIFAQLDRLVFFEVPVKVIVEDETNENFTHRDPVPAVSTITVKGPESLSGTIAYAGLSIDLSQAREDNVTEAVPVLYDANGGVVDSRFFSVTTAAVEVRTEILKQGEIRIAPPEYTGRAAAGYNVTDVKLSPEVLKVEGKDDSRNMSPIELPTIDISGADENVTRTFDVEDLLSERGLTAASDEYLTVTVEIVVERAAPVNVEISETDLNIKGMGENLELAAPIGSISFEVYGNSEDIDSARIYGEIDLSGLGQGSHRVRVTPQLPPGVEAAEPVYVQVELAVREEAPPAEETSEEISSETAAESASEEETLEIGG